MENIEEIEMAEKLAENQQEMEKAIIDNTLIGNNRGQVFGFILGVLAVVVVCLCIFTEYRIGAIVPAIIPIISLAAIFLRRKTP